MEVITIYITDVKQLYIPRKLEIFCEHDRREGSLRFENFRGMLSWFSSVLYVVLYPDIFHSSSLYIFCIKVSKGSPHFFSFVIFTTSVFNKVLLNSREFYQYSVYLCLFYLFVFYYMGVCISAAIIILRLVIN